jgi:hypothetical protein
MEVKMLSVDINYLAILVCAVFAMVLGAIWYGPLFGKPWMNEMGYNEEDLKKDFNPAKTYGLTFITHIVLIYVLARFLGYVGTQGIWEGIRIAFLGWLGFIAATKMMNYLFEQKSAKFFFINSLYHLVVLLVSAVVLSLW